jgi:Polyketide cyclase / dehydrase and lipid transport
VRWFSLDEADAEFIASAPGREVLSIEIPRPAEAVWADLVADDVLHWCRVITSAKWTSPHPFGVGTTRTVRALRVLALRENFFRWEDGRRYSFFVSAASAPLFRRFGEDYLVEETTPGNSRFTWVVAYEPTTFGKAGGPVNSLLTKSLFRDTRRHFGLS